MDSITRSVIRVAVSLDTLAPYTSAKCAEISPCVRPFADSEHTQASTPFSRRRRLGTMTGSKLPVRSPGHLDLHRPDLGQHCLGPTAIAAVARVVAGRVVRLV